MHDVELDGAGLVSGGVPDARVAGRQPAALIEPACVRDASYVTANLSPDDEREARCQLPDGMKTYELAYSLLMGSDAYVAKVRGDPVAVFGVYPMTVCALSVWMMGTKDAWRAVPEITRFMEGELLPRKVAEGYLTMEARTIEDHHIAHQWMRDTGAECVSTPFEYGKHREKFLLFRWTTDAFGAIKRRARPAP
jgi:hypothetical protein